jgi:hypothetical protein
MDENLPRSAIKRENAKQMGPGQLRYCCYWKKVAAR